jgi:hypothetical protein
MAVRGVAGNFGGGLNPNVSNATGILSTAHGGTGNTTGTTTPAFGSSVTATLLTTQNNVALAAGVNRLRWTAASGGSTVTGLQSGNVLADGWEIYVRNFSTTDSIYLPHLSGLSTSGNLFSCPNGQTAQLLPFWSGRLVWDATLNAWTL